MNSLLSISTICQKFPRELLTTYAETLKGDSEINKIVMINTLSEKALNKPSYTPILMKMIEIMFLRKNIKISVANQIYGKISYIESGCKT